MTWTLLHHPSTPGSRKVRVALSELGLGCQIELESYWLRRPEFTNLNVASEVPVLVLDDGSAVVGDQAICEFLDEVKPDRTLLGPSLEQRSETRRLLQWFDQKFAREVTDNIAGEKLVKRLMRNGETYAPVIRAGIANIHYHLDYIGWLCERRSWLAGHEFSLADIAAAAHISLIDYLGDVPWTDHEDARTWYMRVKSRPSFRPLLTETMAGVTPAEHYALLDF
jgi:glutathione S-transferase